MCKPQIPDDLGRTPYAELQALCKRLGLSPLGTHQELVIHLMLTREPATWR